LKAAKAAAHAQVETAAPAAALSSPATEASPAPESAATSPSAAEAPAPATEPAPKKRRGAAAAAAAAETAAAPAAEAPAAPAPAPEAPAAGETPATASPAPDAAAAGSPAASAAAVREASAASNDLDSLLYSGSRPKRVHKPLTDEDIAAQEKAWAVAVARNREARLGLDQIPSDELPAAARAAVAAAAAAGQATPSLEELLRAEGIVQHKPKKGRRIIEDEVAAGGTAVAATVAPRPAPMGGLSLFAQNETRARPIRFLDPATLMREQDKKGSAKVGKGKRKSVVQGEGALGGIGTIERRPRRKTAAKGKSGKQTEVTLPAAHKRVIRVQGGITVAELAGNMGIKGGELVKLLVGMGQMVTVNQLLDLETAQLIAQEYQYEVEDVSFKEEDIIQQDAQADSDAAMQARPPVVTIMGHVDHGKTTLLDAIRNTRVAEGEAGGITQHITAFDVEAKGHRIVFVDTPGHAAFTAMRARGAQVTDIVILVVSAVEGVMPQTVEVIAHAKAAEVPIVVAINKVDLPEANSERVRHQLSEHGLVPENWGGDTQMVEVSAKSRKGLDDLLDSLTVQAEVLELKANPDRLAQGHVVEAQIEKGLGPVAVVLVQKGTLRQGDIVVAGTEFGKVRAIFASGPRREKLSEAGPSTPAALVGFSGLPEAGDEFVVVESEKDARTLVEHRREAARRAVEIKRPAMSLDDFHKRLEEGEAEALNLIIKADVQGSVEAVKKVLSEVAVREIRVNVLHSAVGGITESDVQLAHASRAIIVGFGVRPDAKAREVAEAEGVDIRTYRVIYEAVDEIKKALVGMLEPEYKQKVTGHAEVRNTFKISKVGTVCGCSVQDGKIGRNYSVRLLRNSAIVWEGKVGSLRRFKDDVKEVLQGYECGIGLDGYDDVKEGDILEAFIVEEIRPEA
jgi:translation initiation factor IF-2